MNLAPILLFTYNRPWHTQQTIIALKKNKYAKESEIIIYSDGAKSEKDEEKVKEVRNFLKTVIGFKKVTLVEREENYGLARNIIEGVTKIVNRYGKVIVLEDDIYVNQNFLTFMNNALNFYENTQKVWHISGFNYPIDVEDLPETFLWRFMVCWGWATWTDRWKYFENDSGKLYKEFSKEEIYRFNLDGTYDFFSQLRKNYEGSLDTWAIFWYATIFKQNGLCLNPTRSMVQNIGSDGSGCHGGRNGDLSDKMPLNYLPNKFPNEIIECIKCVEKIKFYLATISSKKPISWHIAGICKHIVRKMKS